MYGSITIKLIPGWIIGFAMVVWFILNIALRGLLKINFFNKLIHGKPDFLIREGKLDIKKKKL